MWHISDSDRLFDPLHENVARSIFDFFQWRLEPF